MRKSLATLLLAVGATALVANFAFADLDGGENLHGKVINADLAKELQSRAVSLGTSSDAPDTTYVGFTPSRFNATNNWWSIWSGTDKDGDYNRPRKARGGLWDFETPVNGDSLGGWWSFRNQMTGTGGLTLPDVERPWRCLDYGNNANYVFGSGKTFGVVGVWHVDGGNTVVIPNGAVDGQKRSLNANFVQAATGATTLENDGGVKWAPLEGTNSAWMGLRRHYDNTYSDPITGNPFNEDVLQFNFNGALSTGATDKLFPGYGAQMDQILYRDVVLPAGVTSVSVSFTYRTSMSPEAGSNNVTRSGWFQHDPLTVSPGGANPNFYENCFTCDLTSPRDSFMVYVGLPAEGAVKLSDGNTHTIYDPLRRWFGEVLRSAEGKYREVFTKGGTNAATPTVVGLTAGDLTTIGYDSITGTKVRLAFRVKTNQAFDDETYQANGYSSGGVGAAIVDAVSISTNLGPLAFAGVDGNFNATTDIDNSADALLKWRSTGKPPQPFHHVHKLTPRASSTLVYEDICGQPDNPARICNMEGLVVSAGDHDHNERSGGTFGTAEQEPFQGIWSPVIQLAADAVAKNAINLDADDATPTDDYYIDYELYTGIFDFFNQGNAWRFGFQAFPAANSTSLGAGSGNVYSAQTWNADGRGQHKRWGEIRFAGFIYFNPDKQCFRNFDAVTGNGLNRTTNLTTIPDSCRIYVGTRQEVYRFGIPQSEWEGGAYWDNIALAIVDGAGADPVSVDIWQLTHDTFPNTANNVAPAPGTANFDTTTALIKTGINIAPTTGNTSRFAVPGDTTVIIAEGDAVTTELVFRILPGPGNYTNPTAAPAAQVLKKAPTSPTAVTAWGATSTNFWESYMHDNGAHGSTPKGHVDGATPKWDPQTWNSARLDTAEVNVFQTQNRGIVTPGNAGLFMTAYHETEMFTGGDPAGHPETATNVNRGKLCVLRNVCFVATIDNTQPTSAVVCGSGAVPPGVTYPPFWAIATVPNLRAIAGTPAGCAPTGAGSPCRTCEGTKIIPDGLLTPGSHVEYFFRRSDAIDPIGFAMCPDTNTVTPQNAEGSTDGHRWQQFGVLPDRWKAGTYVHPVLGTNGAGNACMLYIDQNDRRGNERTWVGVADSIGATASAKYGAHNGWHAGMGTPVGGIQGPQSPNAGGDWDVTLPVFSRGTFVRQHVGQPGTTWDMYGVKASESLNTGPGSIGSRGTNIGELPNYSFSAAANTQMNNKNSRLGPSFDMLNNYYDILMILSGDLNSAILGPFNNKSQDDTQILHDFLASGSTLAQPNGLFVNGDGFVESEYGFGSQLLVDCGIVDPLVCVSYLACSGNTAFSVDLVPDDRIDPSTKGFNYGLRNACTFTLDMPDFDGSPNTSIASWYGAPSGGYTAGVLREPSPTFPFYTYVAGWDIENLHSKYETTSHGRVVYYFNLFSNLFSKICVVQGSPSVVNDVPNNDDGRLFNFMSLANNPMKSGSATVNFGLARAERVKIQIFDVSGRLIRTLADRSFTAGDHKLTWDGVDNANKQVARGVYFVRSQHADSRFTGNSRLVVLK